MRCRVLLGWRRVVATASIAHLWTSIALRATPILWPKRRQLWAAWRKYGREGLRVEWFPSRSSDGSLAVHVEILVRLPPDPQYVRIDTVRLV